MNYFTIPLLTILFYVQYFGNIEFCAALMLDEGDPCKDPVEACEELEDGFLVYNPANCHQSYACILDYTGNVVPSDNPLTCSDGLAFDYEIQNCSSKIESCNKACVNKACYFECSADVDGFVADINDCSVYYFCYLGVISAPAYCNNTHPYFDGNECTDKDYLCCDTCTAYCTSDDSGKNISDSFDCTAYYTCESGQNYPYEDEHYYCPEGQYFDSDHSVCTNMTELCEDICNAIPTTATEPTSTISTTSQYTTTTERTTGLSTTESSTSEQSTTKPLTSEQLTSEPSTAESTTSEISTIESSTVETSSSEQSTTEASTTVPSTFEQSTSEPSTAESTASERSTIKSSTVETSSSEQSTTEASTTVPSTFEQSTSEQSTTGISTYEEKTTVSPLSTQTPLITNPGP